MENYLLIGVFVALYIGVFVGLLVTIATEERTRERATRVPRLSVDIPSASRPNDTRKARAMRTLRTGL